MCMQQLSNFKRPFLIFVLALLTIALLITEQTQIIEAQTVAPENAPLIDQLIIQYKPAMNLSKTAQAAATDQMARLTAVTNTELTYFRQMSGEAHVLKLDTPVTASEAVALAAQLETLPEVTYAEPDWILEADWAPNDPQWANQWHYYAANGINLDDALDVTNGNANMVVAVIDTGILFNHPDLAGRTVGGYDFISDPIRANDGDGRDSNASDPGDWVTAGESATSNTNHPCYRQPPTPQVGERDSSWHGTHVAGTIGAATHNNVGVAAISTARILPVRVLGKCGSTNSDVLDAIRWAAGLPVAGVPNNAFPARVINMSLSSAVNPPNCPTSTQQAIDAARAAGAIIVVSAGNTSMDASTRQPANCNGVITVAGTDQSGNRSLYGGGAGSNFGALVEISAPGTAVMSTMNDGTAVPFIHSYAARGGTSMATPHVAGVISLVLDVRPNLNTEQIVDLLQYTTQGFPANSTCNTSLCGAGILDANAAVRDIFVIKGSTNGFGLPSQPYGSLHQANNAAWDGANLHIRADSFSGSYTFNKEMTLTAVGGTVTIGQP